MPQLQKACFFFFCPDWRHLPFAFERLSKMCELTARCCSLPSEARSSFHSPKGCWANPPLCQIPPAFSVPSTFKEAFDYWMPLAWRMNPTAQSFCVQLISLLWLESEPAGGGLRFLCGVRDRTMLHRFSKWIQLLSKQLRPRKSNNFFFLYQHQHLLTGVWVRGGNKVLLSAQGNLFSYKDRQCFLKTPVEISLCNY